MVSMQRSRTEEVTMSDSHDHEPEWVSWSNEKLDNSYSVLIFGCRTNGLHRMGCRGLPCRFIWLILDSRNLKWNRCSRSRAGHRTGACAFYGMRSATPLKMPIASAASAVGNRYLVARPIPIPNI